MRNRAVVLIALLSSGLFAQTARVPFVGCESFGQAEVKEAPRGIEQIVQLKAITAQRLAYYQASSTSGALAPRGWYCFGISGSSSSQFFVSAQPIKRDDLFRPDGGIGGPAIEVEWIEGGGSGTAMVAEVWARVFPAYWPIVKGLIYNGDLQAADYTFGPYPGDKLIAKAAQLVRFQTRPRSEGLGTMGHFKANDDPIDGVAILEGKTPDLLMLRVRLPREQRDLAPVIIQDLLIRQRRDAR